MGASIFEELEVQEVESGERLDIDVSSKEGISQSTLENQIKETLRQIGARVEEDLEQWGL